MCRKKSSRHIPCAVALTSSRHYRKTIASTNRVSVLTYGIPLGFKVSCCPTGKLAPTPFVTTQEQNLQ
jgi:hypothetical protein